MKSIKIEFSGSELAVIVKAVAQFVEPGNGAIVESEQDTAEDLLYLLSAPSYWSVWIEHDDGSSTDTIQRIQRTRCIQRTRWTNSPDTVRHTAEVIPFPLNPQF